MGGPSSSSRLCTYLNGIGGHPTPRQGAAAPWNPAFRPLEEKETVGTFHASPRSGCAESPDSVPFGTLLFLLNCRGSRYLNIGRGIVAVPGYILVGRVHRLRSGRPLLQSRLPGGCYIAVPEPLFDERGIWE